MKSLLPLLVLLPFAASLNFLVYIPMFGRSHVTFMGRLADVLVEAGHNVTVIGPVIERSLGTYGVKKAKVIVVESDPVVRTQAQEIVQVIPEVWRSQSRFDMIDTIRRITAVTTAQCRKTLKDAAMWAELRSQRFDVAFSEPMDKCGFHIFNELGITKTALTLSLGSFEGVFEITGNPSFPSYVPGLAAGSSSDRMTFVERVLNTVGLAIQQYNMPSMMAPFDEIARAQFGPNTPGVMSLFKNSSYTFLNSEVLINYPKVTVHKIVEIGGISISGGHKPLNKTWSDIFDLRPQTVLLSFGTVARSYLMPDEYKTSIKRVLAKFPNVTFIWKYEVPEHRISEGIPNVIESTYVPQNDILYDPRLTLFITHCGQGSTTEATTAGVPLIVIPVMGDQKQNAKLIERLGSGIALEKEDLATGETLEAAIREMLTTDRYALVARRVGQTIRDKPFRPDQVFVRHMEFLAKHGPLRQLDHYGQQLNFVQYYLIDVFAFLAAVAITLIVISFLILQYLLRQAKSFLIKQKIE